MPNMYVYHCKDSRSVELVTNTDANVVAEWIPGEGADIALYRDRETGKVVGVRLEAYGDELQVAPERISGEA